MNKTIVERRAALVLQRMLAENVVPTILNERLPEFYSKVCYIQSKFINRRVIYYDGRVLALKRYWDSICEKI